jgi:hypothetical protein
MTSYLSLPTIDAFIRILLLATVAHNRLTLLKNKA